MDCTAFRRRLLEAPACDDPAFVAHRRGCDACAEEAREAERIEAALTRLIKVTPPPDLKARLRPPARGRGRPRLALAAAIVGAIALGLLSRLGDSAADADARLVAELVGHLGLEPQALAQREPISAQALHRLTPRVRVEAAGLGYPITYAMPCVLMDRPGLHLVLQMEEGPVTVLVVSDLSIGEPRLVHQGQLRGLVRPVANGSLAVFGHELSALEALAQAMAPHLRFSI